MALTSGFYPSKNGDRKYSAEQFGSLFEGIITEGILPGVGDDFMVRYSGSGLTVNVCAGKAWYGNIWVYNTGVIPMTLSAAEALQYRKDAIVLRIDKESARAASIYIAKGTPSGSSNPSAPTISSTATDRRIVLATVRVKPGASSIATSDIDNFYVTKDRKYSTGLVKTADFNTVFAQWNNQFTAFKNNWDSTMRSLQISWETNFDNIRTYWGTEVNLTNPQGQFPTLYKTWWDFFGQLSDTWQTTFNNLLIEWTGRFRGIESEFRTLLNNLYIEYRDKLLDYSNQFEAFIFDSNQTFESFMTRIDGAFDAFEAQKQREIDEMLSNLGSEFESFWQEFKALMNDYLSGQETIWEDWFSHIQGQLDEDAAGHLQNQIDALTYFYVIDRELVIPNTAGSVSGTELILGVPTRSVQVPAFAVNTNSGHLEYESAANFNVNDASGHIEWEVT